jgi:hypothetical protein
MCASDQKLLAAVHAADAIANFFKIGQSGNFCALDVSAKCTEHFDLSEEFLAALKNELCILFD